MDNNDYNPTISKLEKMATLGNLLTGLAHEINTPLSAIKSNSELSTRFIERFEQAILNINSQSEPVDTSELTRLLEEYKKLNEINMLAMDRVMNIVKAVKNVARHDKESMEVANLNEILKKNIYLIQHKLKENIQIKVDFGEIPPVKCYPIQISQIFLNLFVNAIQAIDGPGELAVKSYQKDDNVFVEVKDTGEGIPEENLEKIFESGFTTKNEETGTGLGLSIVKKLLDLHNGEIFVESEVGKGTKFTVSIPIKED